MYTSDSGQLEVPVEEQTPLKTNKRKRCSFTLEQKSKIYERYLEKELSIGKLAAEFNCPKSTVQTIVSNRPYASATHNRKYRQPNILHTLEGMVMSHIQELRESKIPVTRSVRKHTCPRTNIPSFYLPFRLFQF